MRPEEIERIKELLPTTLGSAEIRAKVAADILRRAVFSARMASVPYLAKVREVCAAISAGTINQAEARAQLISTLAQLGYETVQGPKSKVQSTLDIGPSALDSSHASIRRLNLIVDTQRQMAASVAKIMGQNEGILHQFPAWELARLGSRSAPRADWPARWRAAGDSVGWEGALKDRFIALKSSPIWQALGDGAGGFTDTLGNPYPPFAYGSGMAWLQVDRAACERYGLGGLEGSGDLEAPTLSPTERAIAEAARKTGFEDFFKDLA